MDASQYPSNGINTTSASYPSPPAITPHQLQHTNSPLPHQTLPPLQPQTSAAMNQMYGSNPHTPRTPATPNTPGSANNMPAYPQQQGAQAGRGGPYQQMGQYPPPPQGYSQSMLPQTTMASSHPQPIAPAPASGRVPPVLRPMPAGGVMPQPGMNSPYGPGGVLPGGLGDGDQPTHVVGSQGRRGILPSAPGRPAATPAGSGNAKQTVIPVKDADGKFPCPHCTKTYLHAKHLKRHLLRHTGDRPYMCVLCRDTFSRSDILKRHFQKCSIRRGNPTGASHLSHPQAHVKKNAAAQKAALGQDGGLNHLNGLGNMSADGMVQPFGMMPVSDGMSNLANDQSQLSRSSSLTRLDNGSNQDRRDLTGPVMDASGRGGNFDQAYNGNVPSSMTPNMNQQMQNYNMPPGQNGMSMYGGSNSNQQSGLDWSQMFQAGAQQTYANQFPPNLGQTQIATKLEPNNGAEKTDGLPGPPHHHHQQPPDSLFYSTWGVPPSIQDPFTLLSNQILNFFYPPGSSITNESAGFNLYFSPDNIRDFLEKYTHFHVHFPILHTPTFRILESYTGLLAGMCCMGACYSDRLSPDHVRDMMNFLRAALIRDVPFLANTVGKQQNSDTDISNSRNGQRDIEELQAVMLLQILLMWNGTPQHRETAREFLPAMAEQSRKLGLLEVSTAMSLFSPLHQSNFTPQNFDVSTFDWGVWVEQEKRIRLMHIIFLCNSAMELYFNAGSQLDSFEMHIPLPSDDAAWDARNKQDCEEALGLRGEELARQKNPNGTRRSKQPELNLALQALLHASYQIQPGRTNLYGKFLLIHAILSLVRRAQLDGNTVMKGYATPPMSEWMVNSGAEGTGVNSGRATPVDSGIQGIPAHVHESFRMALHKFKLNWDADMVNQFPPGSAKNARRYGFSRDGIHFYWLAKYLLKHTRSMELQMDPDTRFMQVMQLLKSVKAWVMSDGATRGEELGSVGEIDKEFGAANLTLDIARLFKPLPVVVEDPAIPSVQTNIVTVGGGMV
ncbi:Respiration factor 2-like protein 1 [Colletotrichum chlorophyti]|uniref:Respiration factor 2-like protein 1 n=1 Tax=Colletotrichum chlorophyti TaxID=708187 RepID=A0A1Q8S2K8_9PEZI|nr:Respiration factor 2-like protein 1 [Colletotrichum chlorophyti]